MKAVLSIVLGIAMVLGQFATAAPNGSGGPVAACDCPSCAKFNCCDTTSPSVPLAPPAPSSTDLRVQAPALTVIAVLRAPAAASSSIALLSCQHLLSKRAAVPVYDRNCSYLI
jgi:hypothetical protein